MVINYWQQLSEKDRWVSILGLICLVIYLFYLFVYSPLTTAVSNKSNQLQEKIETLNWMQTLESPRSATKNLQKINTSKLLALIATQLAPNPYQAFPYQLQQIGADNIQLSFQKVPYSLIMKWLWDLTTHYTVNLKEITIVRTDVSGSVKWTALLSAN